MFKRILVPLDRSALAEQAIGQAALIARGAKAEIDLVLVHTPFPFAPEGYATWEESEWTADQTYLDAVANDLQSGSSVPVSYEVLRGVPADRICERALDADLVVMTSHGRTGMSRAWLGSVADAVVRRTPAPVLILRPRKTSKPRSPVRRGFKHILVPIDGSELAGEALGPAIDLATALGADLTLFRAIFPVPLVAAYDATIPLGYQPMIVDEETSGRLISEMKDRLATIAERLHEAHGIPVSLDVVASARPADAILQCAHEHEIDCIAMSTHGRGMSRLFVGSVADKILRGSGLPVLLRRPVGVVENYLGSEEEAAEIPALRGMT